VTSAGPEARRAVELAREHAGALRALASSAGDVLVVAVEARPEARRLGPRTLTRRGVVLAAVDLEALGALALGPEVRRALEAPTGGPSWRWCLVLAEGGALVVPVAWASGPRGQA
jgi:hypothetical protein